MFEYIKNMQRLLQWHAQKFEVLCGPFGARFPFKIIYIGAEIFWENFWGLSAKNWYRNVLPKWEGKLGKFCQPELRGDGEGGGGGDYCLFRYITG